MPQQAKARLQPAPRLASPPTSSHRLVMEQTKALNALEPFLALSKSATSPRQAAEIVTQATSAPNTFIFAELLQAPQVQALSSSPEFAPHLALLQTFSYGTYQSYRAESTSLPALNDAQSLKLRKLSLLTLARDRSNLSYDSLQDALGLSSAPELEDLVVKAVYDGLLHATLDPARQAVEVTSIAPLQDLQPGAIPGMIAALDTWSGRCTSTLDDIDAQIKAIRTNAVARAKEKRAADDKMQRLLGDLEKKSDHHGRDGLPRRVLNKRSMLETGSLGGDETMELDEPVGEEPTKRHSKKKQDQGSSESLAWDKDEENAESRVDKGSDGQDHKGSLCEELADVWLADPREVEWRVLAEAG
ncbi:COP9 signalosome subunit 7 (CsnG) [Purpureocillium lavendulum]|uniref:COP9 signalosome subunit 7 (CsnG) n=1 Tax=Purpureocillium lavendulum TaxID=1247861 RepID=A0AB34FYB8_9HYPO|nr:COP9 signalosome subunit 7 (CsnG) [Purpureocillium lavendulum]